MIEIPTVKLQLDQMRHSILVSFATHSKEIQKAVEDAVAQQLTTENFEHELQESVRVYMNAELKNAIQSAAYKAVREPAVAEQVSEAVKAALLKMMKRADWMG